MTENELEKRKQLTATVFYACYWRLTANIVFLSNPVSLKFTLLKYTHFFPGEPMLPFSINFFFG